MAVGPIEVIRAQEATQLRHVDSQRLQHAQEQSSRNFQDMVRQEHNKTNQAAKSDNNEYRYDAKEKGNSQYEGSGGKKRGKEQKKEVKESKDKPRSGGFDILI
jgi:hypothetical protein